MFTLSFTDMNLQFPIYAVKVLAVPHIGSHFKGNDIEESRKYLPASVNFIAYCPRFYK